MHLLYAFLFLLTLVGIAVGRYPRLAMNRATIALVGATLLIFFRAIPLEQAYHAIELNTITLLFAMMILNYNLRLAGFFDLIVQAIVSVAKTPRQLLFGLLLASALLSALFLNDTIVLVMTPLVLAVVLPLRRDPIPYLIALATSANIGSVATIIGNPQNMLIGIQSKISFLRFAAILTPVALLGIAISYVTLLRLFPKEFAPLERLPSLPPTTPAIYLPLLRKGIAAMLVMLLALLLGSPIPLAALLAASLLLVSRRFQPETAFREFDWSLLVFFASLFVITKALDTTGFSTFLFTLLKPAIEGGILTLSAVSVLLSNLISNVPAVMLFSPLVPSLPRPEEIWLILAMATTLAGNLTLLGSVANLIVAESAQRQGVHLSFGAYLKAGLPITLLSLAAGIAYLTLLFRVL